ncbi:MAG: hypothetical protein OEO82_05235 [Gammaproteobacteria bacterium]|nr:hypothetical protein [Gammaproteobacteria bacterium]
MIGTRSNQFRIALIGFSLALVAAWFCYRPAIGGAFQLDDLANLGGLANVEDARSAADFILSGEGGPSGRPLALATFALQAESWSQGPAAFLSVNILIHLLNAIVLAWCLYRLALLQALEAHRAVIIAAAAAAMWVLMPLLSTATMLVVQRMTSLSALFVLLGLGCYLLARSRIETAPSGALVGMSASLVIGTALATLCKESGLLLPVFVLVVEATLLRCPKSVTLRRWRVWQLVFLVLPTVALLAFLASLVSYSESTAARRGFDGWERALTQTRILWLYLVKAVVGAPGQLGIFQDMPRVSRSLFEQATLLASFAWIMLACAAVVWRRRYPLASLAVLWYLAGHLLESTVVPLELYFEHRNYLPVVGPLYAVASLLLAGSTRLRTVAAAVITAFLLLNAYFLYSFASLWGEPSLASRYWAMKYPDSVRAVMTMATYQLQEEGPLRTLQTIDSFVIRHPQHAYLRIQELNLRCMVMADQDHSRVVMQLEKNLPTVDFTFTAGKMLSQLFSTLGRTSCNGVDAATVAALADKLRSNPRYQRNTIYNRFHFKLLAGIARRQGDYAATLENLRRAMTFGRSSELDMMMVTALGGAGDFDAANDYIDDALARIPANPVQAVKWRRDLGDLRAYVRELEKSEQ